MAQKYINLIKQHLDSIIENGTDKYGPVHTDMWLSVLDTKTGLPPDEPHTPARVYRLIGAPQGSTLYWDQPLVVAAYELSQITGNQEYKNAAEKYFLSFLEHCIDEDGMFLWGNHKYYDVYKDKIISFSNGYHELRPITPAWELFWQLDKDKTEKYIRTFLPLHVYNMETGGFNRHDDVKKSHAFIESGGILAESAAWLYSKTDDQELFELALKIVRYSYSHRGETTGLLVNQPDHERWDSKVSTTEVGVWAQSLLRAAELSADNEFTEMAANAVSAYLKYGYDANEGLYYGQLSVETGEPVVLEEEGYWPRAHADIWSTDQWPSHDYPIALAEACITLYRKTGEEQFKVGVQRMAEVVAKNTPAKNGEDTYAEHYGRCIHFLLRAAQELNIPNLKNLAGTLADEAVEKLFENGMFQGLPNTHFYESVDGVGYLALALIYLKTEIEPEMYGFGF